MGGNADRHGRQGVPLGVLEVYAGTREGHHKRVCGKLPIRLRLDDSRQRHEDTRQVKAKRLTG